MKQTQTKNSNNIHSTLDEYKDKNTGESTDGPTIFNWDSEYRKNHIDVYKTQTERQLQVLDNTFNGRQLVFRDNIGRRIINITEDKLWFKDYVSLIFSIGCIFNENDREKLDTLLKVFENDGEVGFLMNFKKVLNYNDKLIKVIENKLELGNGNYHLCLITIVTTDDTCNLSKAPEKQYAVSGVINKYCEWDEIYKFMEKIIARYGLATEQILTHDDKLSWEMGTEGLAVKTVRHTEVESSFDLDIDPNNENQIRLDRELEFMKEREEIFNTRQRSTKMLRDNKDASYNPYRNRFIKNGSLYTRIHREDNCGIVDDSLNDEHKGVQLRMNERIMPPDRERQEYQLYNSSETYVDGKNVMDLSNVATREQIPRFTQTSVRGAKSRVITSTPVLAIKNSM